MNQEKTVSSQMSQGSNSNPTSPTLFTLATRLTGLSCPRCGSTAFHRHGKDLGIQRFRCQDCGRTFKETVNTPLHWIHNKNKMQDYLHTMHDRQSLRAAAEQIGISEVTSFNWRHKILSSLGVPTTPSSSAPAGICEIRLPHSFKGQRNIPDKKMPETRTILIADARGIPCLHLLQNKNKRTEVSELLVKKIHHSAEITSEKINLLTRAGLKAEKKKIRNRTCKKSIMGQASAKIKDLTDWMARFNGVATRYLQQYWNWYRTETNLESLEKFRLECFGHRQLASFRKLKL